MDAPSLPEWTRFTSASTLELAEAVLAQYKANVRWMSAIIAVMKERVEPPAQSPKQSSPAFDLKNGSASVLTSAMFALQPFSRAREPSSVARAAAEPNGPDNRTKLLRH